MPKAITSACQYPPATGSKGHQKGASSAFRWPAWRQPSSAFQAVPQSLPWALCGDTLKQHCLQAQLMRGPMLGGQPTRLHAWLLETALWEAAPCNQLQPQHSDSVESLSPGPPRTSRVAVHDNPNTSTSHSTQDPSIVAKTALWLQPRVLCKVANSKWWPAAIGLLQQSTCLALHHSPLHWLWLSHGTGKRWPGSTARTVAYPGACSPEPDPQLILGTDFAQKPVCQCVPPSPQPGTHTRGLV